MVVLSNIVPLPSGIAFNLVTRVVTCFMWCVLIAFLIFAAPAICPPWPIWWILVFCLFSGKEVMSVPRSSMVYVTTLVSPEARAPTITSVNAACFSGRVASSPPLAWTRSISGKYCLIVSVRELTFVLRSRIDWRDSTWLLILKRSSPSSFLSLRFSFSYK